MDATRALLDSLMGKDRNSAPDSKRQSFKDPDVCKYHLVGDCPHEMWLNQGGKASPNSPVGPCKKQHSEAMRERLKEDKDYVKYRWRYLEDLRLCLQKLVDENNKKAQKVKDKLKEGVTCTSDTHKAVEGHLTDREREAQEKLQEAEKMAEEGNLETSKIAQEEMDKLAHQKLRLTRLKEVADAWMDECCEICGSQISWRAVEELEARSKGREHPHVPGAWHQGWKRCRESLKKVTEESIKAREACKGLDVGDVLNEGERGRSRDRDKEKARKTSPSKEKEKRKDDKEKGKDKEKREKDKRSLRRSFR
ncbi:unnamed protein product [Effrenium voratum]|nr:unnamed protein product [Effrenium voratum]